MRIACPHCQATYEIDAMLTDAVFICHRCGNEFNAHNEDHTNIELPVEDQLPLFGEQKSPATQASPPPTETPRKAVPENEAFDGIDTVNYQPPLSAEPLPPRPYGKRIWPWLVSVLLVTIITGFWLQKDNWLDNRWFRSTATNLGLPMEQRDKDWRVIPESVHAQWIIRDDQSRALLIEGRVENLLASELPAPKIEVVFFATAQPDQILLSRLHEITLPPTMTSVRHAPFSPPDRDIIPLAPLGQRGFILLLESLPENTGDFALTARAIH